MILFVTAHKPSINFELYMFATFIILFATSLTKLEYFTRMKKIDSQCFLLNLLTCVEFVCMFIMTFFTFMYLIIQADENNNINDNINIMINYTLEYLNQYISL